ncbi:unnamed protein product [Cunninghamella blakesleeana]
MVNSHILDVSHEELLTLKKAFKLYDKDGDGKINVNEFINIVMKLEKKMNKEKATQLAKSTDKNKDNSIDFDEFVSAMVQLLPFTENTPPSTPPPSSLSNYLRPSFFKSSSLLSTSSSSSSLSTMATSITKTSTKTASSSTSSSEPKLHNYTLRKWNTHPPPDLYHNDSDDEDEHKEDNDLLMQVFNTFDYNHDGFISISKLDKVMKKLGENLSKQELQDMINEADTNRDGCIDFEEFKRIIK